MKLLSPGKIAIAASTFACALLLSPSWSGQGNGLSLSIDKAQARVGHPATPMSGAGVARRHARRDAYRYGYGPGPVGVGAAAVGTAAAIGAGAAVAATSPWGAGPYYYGGRPYYSGNPYAARAYYGGPYAASTTATTSAPPWNIERAYYQDGPWYGYSGWDDYKARNGITCEPGTLIKGADGLQTVCQ